MVKAEQSAPAKEGKNNFKNLLQDYFRYYCERSTVHCVRYLYDSRLHHVERVIWSVLLIISVNLCCVWFLVLSQRFGAQKLQTVIDDAQYPVFYVEFPAVAVCTDNRVNWIKLEAAKQSFLPANASEELIAVFTKLVIYMETLRFDNFKYSISEMEDQNLEALDFIDLTSLATFLSLRCEDIIVPDSCRWRHSNFNCCDYFVMERTEYGLCLVFNSELSNQPREKHQYEDKNYYPRHNAKAGQNTGLTFELLLNERFKRPESSATDNVYIMIKKPNQVSNMVYSIIPNTLTGVTVRPQLTSTDENTRNIPPERRNCQFTDEHIGFGIPDKQRNKKFLLANCLNSCHESYLVNMCNCTMPIFFLGSQKIKNCTASNLRCISLHNDIFSYDKHLKEDDFFSATKPGMNCPCLVSCNLLEYYTSTTTLPLNTRNTRELAEGSKYFKVDVYYQVEMMITYRTSLEFSSIDLIANLGGIFGLCLGASMVSAVELIYYLTVGFAVHLYDHDYHGVLRDKLIQRWHKLINYLRNCYVQKDALPVKEINKSQLRHPFNNRTNAW